MKNLIEALAKTECRWSIWKLAGICGSVLALTATGCGVNGTMAGGPGGAVAQAASGQLSGILHGGPNPISGATVTLYFTGTSGYGLGATAVASTTTDVNGSFTLGNPSSSCPSGGYAYVTSYGGNTGANAANPNVLLMVPVGACSAIYTPTYNGSSLWIDELTTAVSAYALGNFTTIGGNGSVSIGAPANNTGTASPGTPGVAGTQSAAGLAHAFANALAIINNHTGQVNAYTHGGSTVATGGVIPQAEISLLGNILQACVNSTGVSGSNSATANDGTPCGKLFSLTTPPQIGAVTPSNTLQAMLDLAKYPRPALNTWNSTCTAAGGGTTTATSCLFGLAPSTVAYSPALTSAPPDWSLAIVYSNGYGGVPSNPGIRYPVYVALDYNDNVYVLNWSDNQNSGVHASTNTNIVALGFDGTPIFSSTPDTTDLYTATLATDTNGHVLTANNSASTNNVLVYSSTSGTLLQSIAIGGGSFSPRAVVADPFNSLYTAGANTSSKVHQFTYSTGTSSYNTTSNVLQLSSAASGAYAMVMDANYDLYELSQSSSPAVVYVQNGNSSSLGSAPTFAATGTTITGTFTGSTSSGGGIAIHCPCLGSSTNSAYLLNSPATLNGSGQATLLTPGSSSIAAGSVVSTLSTAGAAASPKYQYAAVDGNGWVYTVDGVYQPSGVTVFDTVDSLTFGLYKGCFVSAGVCAASGSSAVDQPTSLAVDSAGDLWVTSGDSGTGATPTGFLTEFIGAAAPTWPGLSMAKFGLPN